MFQYRKRDRGRNLSLGNRILAAGIAGTAWTGLGLRFQASLGQLHSVLATAWVMLFYFTIITNLLAAILFTALALGNARIASPFNIAAVTIAIMLVGIVYSLLLNGLLELSGGEQLADILNHKVTPVLVTLFWLFATKHGRLGWRDPANWALLPLAYFGYGLSRGYVQGKYPYPFMNPEKLGWGAVCINAAEIALGFLAVGYAMVWLDRRLAGRR